jgi:hypothetical protein
MVKKIIRPFRYLKNASVSIQINLKKGQTVLIIMIRNQDYTKYYFGREGNEEGAVAV